MAERRKLPLGSVVLLEGVEELVCVIGYDAESADDNRVYKFSGVVIPTGFTSANKICMFNSDAIKKIYSVGRMLGDDEALVHGFGNAQCVEGLLPTGSIVRVKDVDMLFLIIGAGVTDSGREGKIFDYVAAPYPDGYLGAEELFLLNREDLEDILHVGFLYDGQFEYEKEVLRYIAEERNKA